ncbi:transcription factor Tfb2-domain-containing protein [Crepidotus variabilis]|uniref:RNA polymerase II transcription factor B subunit 2 n=1 Tax=Crepidotus variabilis TaxID=179855 RepID=A0A9P6EQ65_9AGAR|nr:transcription factor Tfb2-domain-containing protein [Crepidotus variabilis]
MPSVQLNSHSENAEKKHIEHALLPFLQSQSQNTLTRLYQRPSSCLSLFRLLEPVERQIIMSLLWLESAIPQSTMNTWVNREGRKLYDEAIATLGRLNILPTNLTNKLALNTTFKMSFRQALTGGGTSGSFGVPAENDDKSPAQDLESLDSFALERWETILHYMVSSGTEQQPTKPSQGVLYLLQRSGLMSTFQGVLRITSAGFQFLLHSPHDQLWDLLLQYLHLAEERQMDLVEVLGFIFMLSTMELGKEYSTENLSGTQKAMLEDLRDYGLIWQRKPTSRRFSPTRLATTLTSASPPLPTSSGNSSGPQEGFIILETNYRVYAYTDNPLQTAVLNLFVSLKYRFPNLVVGSITRESVRKALANGITADQIISYLMSHAHPQMRKNNPLLPVTVQDQIRLWELERNRLKSQEGYLYTAFASQADYEFVLHYAKELDVVLWENASRRCFFGTLGGHANIKGFIERRAMGSNQ